MKRFLLACALAAGSGQAMAITAFEMPWVNADQAGAVYRTADHPNGIFVLEFFANYCGPCNENAPNVDELAEKYAGEERVQVLDTALDAQDSEITKWINKHHPNHPVIKDVARKVWKQVGGQYIPTMVVTDCKGNIKFQYTGVWDAPTKRRIHATIDTLLGQTCE